MYNILKRLPVKPDFKGRESTLEYEFFVILRQ